MDILRFVTDPSIFNKYNIPEKPIKIEGKIEMGLDGITPAGLAFLERVKQTDKTAQKQEYLMFKIKSFLKNSSSAYLNGSGNSNSFGIDFYRDANEDGILINKLRPSKNTSSYFTSTLTNVLQSDAYKNLTDEAKSDTLTTRHGDGKLFLDFYDDNDKLGIGKFSSVALLFSFDSNKDGYINGDDELFHKIKVRGYDKDGNEMIMSLSEFTDGFGVDLTKFINKNIINYTERGIREHNKKAETSNFYEAYDISKIDNRITYYSSNPYTAFASEYRYKKLDDSVLKEFFDANADADGWVSLRNNNVFNKDNGLNNFAYEKFGFDGKLRLSEFRPIVEEQLFDGKLNYGKFQKERFMKFYDDYQKESKTHAKNIEWLSENLKKYGAENADKLIANLKDSKSAYMIAMQNEFKNATGLDFSERNLKKVMLTFRKDTQRAAAALADSDSVIAMKRNGDNSYTLRFDSGREIVVSAIYSDTGKLIANNKGLSGLVKLKAQSLDEISLRKLEFSSTAIKDAEGKFKTLKEIGTKFIDIISNEQGTQFLITLQDGSTINEKDLYNISFLKNTLEHKNGFLRDDKNSQDKTKKMYQKVDRLV